VQAAIEHTLHLGASLDDVAAALDVHPRTLQRQLERGGTTLRVVRHRAQMAQAREWLAQSVGGHADPQKSGPATALA
jgi:AraC-like DNA-binding protein